MKAADSSASRPSAKPRVPKPGDSPVKKGAATENCDPNVSAKRSTPGKVLRAKPAASPKRDLDQFLAPVSEERHGRSPVREEAAVVVEVASSPPAKAGNLKSDTSPRKRLEQSLTPFAAGDHHPSCVAHSKSLQNWSGATTPARKHICKSARCAANDPDYALPAPTPPRKFLLSKRHILQLQLEESLKRYKKCCPDVGASGHLDPVENVQMQAEEARTGILGPSETGGSQPVYDLLFEGLEPDTEAADQAGMQASEPVGVTETESGGTKAEDKLAGTEVTEAGVPEGKKDGAPEHMQSDEAVLCEDTKAIESILTEDIDAADMGDFQVVVTGVTEASDSTRMEEIATGVLDCMEKTEAVVLGDTEAIEASRGTGPLVTEDLEELRAFKCPAVSEDCSQDIQEPGRAINTLDGKAVPEGLEDTDETELVDNLQNRSLLGKDMEAAELADGLLESNPASESESVEYETPDDEEWVFLDPSTALLDDDIDSTLVTDVSGRPSLVGNYLTGRVWGRRKSSATIPVHDTEAVNLRKQESSRRKLSSEWKLDHAITEALAGKDPCGEGRVRTLVEAFEKVISLTECDRVLPRHAYRKFSLCAGQKQVAVTRAQPDAETPRPTELSVEWVKVDIMTAGNLEDEDDGAELGAGIRDSIASLISNHGFVYAEVMTANNLEHKEGGAGIRDSVPSPVSHRGLVTAIFGKERSSYNDLEAVHNNFAGIDLWKHSIFAAPAKQVEQSPRGVGSGLDNSGDLEECHRGRGDTGAPDGQSAQLGDADDGMRYSVHPERTSEVEGSLHAISVSDAEDQSDCKYVVGYTCRLRGSQGAGSDQYRIGVLDDNQDLAGYPTNSQGLESEDGNCGAADPARAKGFGVLEGRTKGDKRRLSEGDADSHTGDSLSDHATGHACDRPQGAPYRRHIATTEPQPFKLYTEERGAMHDMAFARKLDQILAEEARRRIPIARGLPWTTDEPEIVPKPPVKEQTRPVEFRLLSTARAVDRADFDRYVAESQQYYEEERHQEHKLHQMAEEEEVRRLRHQMVPRAQLMPYFDQPFQPRRSSKRLTVPKEPNFQSPNKRSKCRGAARWNVPSST